MALIGETTLPLDGFENVVVSDEHGNALLILDGIVNPSGHWVLTVSSGDDEELFQVHSVDGPDGPRAPLGTLTLAIATPDGLEVATMSALDVRLRGSVAVDPHK